MSTPRQRPDPEPPRPPGAPDVDDLEVPVPGGSDDRSAPENEDAAPDAEVPEPPD